MTAFVATGPPAAGYDRNKTFGRKLIRMVV
jgi:hypothetical protein